MLLPRSSHLLIVAALGAATDVAAVTNIRYERWESPAWVRRDVVAPVESVTTVFVSFDAISTASDVANGFRFALAERSPGDNHVLSRIEGRPCAGFPPPGTSVSVDLRCALYCDAAGNLHARDRITWDVVWCSAPEQQPCGATAVPAAAPPGSSAPELFELVVLDENDAEGANPTPNDVLQVEPAGGGVAPFFHFEAPDFAPNGAIGVFKDPDGILCSDAIQPFAPFRWYVVARLDGMTQCGVVGVEMGIHGLPSGVLVNVTPNPHAFPLWGDPFGNGFLAFPCEHGVGSVIVLYTLDGVSSVPLQDVELTVGAAAVPSNLFWPYPWLATCAQTLSPKRRVIGQTFVINPSPGRGCEITVRVEPASWTRIKRLYREPQRQR